uniref:Protein FAR1-RELATED SEQUENCE 6 n=1 Tax=Cacopsylla melanoneura TaxID=428564 RepID=A0A8D9AW04_9HEMI
MTKLLGKLFDNFDSLKCFIKEYEETNFVQLGIWHSLKLETQKARSQNNSKASKLKMAKKELVYCTITYKCIHGGEFKTTGNGQRKTPSFKQNCPFSLKVNLSRNAQNLVITNIAPDHNHEISETVFKSLPRQRQLSDDQKAEVKEMLYLRCNKKLVRKHMVESTGKNVLLKDIHNLKVIKDSNLESTIKYLESTGGYVEVVAREGKLEGIFFQDEIMKNSFKQNPELVLLDATYCLNSLAMPLYILMVINGNGQGQVAAVFILAHETSANLIKMLDIFKTTNPDTRQRLFGKKCSPVCLSFCCAIIVFLSHTKDIPEECCQ